MLILLDMDEVLATLMEGVNKFYNDLHGTNFTLEDYHTYNWWEVWGCSYEYADEICHRFVTGNGHEEMQPIPGSVEGVRQLLERGHRLVVGTSRKPEYADITTSWLYRHYGNATFAGIRLLNQYGEGKVIKKSELGLELKAKVAVDDQVRHAADLASVGIHCLVINNRWNRDQELPSLATRVFSWEDILREVESLDGQR